MDAVCARVLELVAQGWAAQKVEKVAQREVLGVAHAAKGAGEFDGEVLAQLGERRAVGGLLVGEARDRGGRRGGLRFDAVESSAREGISYRGGFGGGVGFVQGVKPALRLAQVAVVEGVGVHFHEDGQEVQREVDLRRPRPVPHERPRTPVRQPRRLKRTLHPLPAVPPPEESIAPRVQ